MQTKVALHLGALTCSAATEQPSQPYIWPILIADETGVPALHAPTLDMMGTLVSSTMQAGQTVDVPAGMDRDLVHVFDDKAAGLVVLIVALFEEDASPKKGTRAVLKHLQDRSLVFVRDRLAECRQTSGERGDLRNALAASLNLAAAERGALEWYEEAATFISAGGFDDSVGLSLWALSGQAIAGRNITFNLSSTSEEFSLSASLEVSSVPIQLCQAERAAVEQAKMLVSSLRGQKASLQAQLQHATPQQKPAIIAAIKRIAEVDQPAADAALAAAEAALEACLPFGGGHGPLDDPIMG